VNSGFGSRSQERDGGGAADGRAISSRGGLLTRCLVGLVGSVRVPVYLLGFNQTVRGMGRG